MMHRRHRLAARFLAISLLAATLFTVDSVASPSSAEARCGGVNNPMWSYLRFNTQIRVSENAHAETCNNNDLYTGVLKDEYQDNMCAIVQFEIPGQGWFFPQKGSGIVCGKGNTSTFEWNDTNDNHQTYERLCIAYAHNLEIVACGWGNDISPGAKGLNFGF